MKPGVIAASVEEQQETRADTSSFPLLGLNGALIEDYLARLIADFLSPHWADVDGLLGQSVDQAGISAAICHDTSRYPEFLAAAAFRLSDTNVRRFLLPDLAPYWLSIPLPAWEKAVACCQAMWISLMGTVDGVAQGAATIQERLRMLLEVMPALTTTMGWIQFRHFGHMSEAIIEAARAQSSAPAQLVNSLWLGEDSLLQTILLRSHSQGQVWPSPMIAKRAVAALRKSASDDNGPLIDSDCSIFWPLRDDHKADVVNLPVLMGFWATTGIAMNWWRRSGRLRQVADIYAFDPFWFQVAYNQGIKIALAYGLPSSYVNGDV